MTPDVVVDVGNSRIKWGRCISGRIVDFTALPPETTAWDEQAVAWQIPTAAHWAVASVQPHTRQRFVTWAEHRGGSVWLLIDPTLLPLSVAVPEPFQVGIDRLLNALAARQRHPGHDALIVAAGTAVTVDWLDATGTFRGGAILPGPRLMAAALHQHTALLPFIETVTAQPTVPGTTTHQAIALGIHAALVGSVRHLRERIAVRTGRTVHDLPVFLTGGAASLLRGHVEEPVIDCPTLTLEGIWFTADAQS